MPESKRIYRVNSNDVTELNRVLAQIGNRLDELEGFRGQPTIRDDMKITDSKFTIEDPDGTTTQSMGGT
jgi:hypothetical protein